MEWIGWKNFHKEETLEFGSIAAKHSLLCGSLTVNAFIIQLGWKKYLFIHNNKWSFLFRDFRGGL